MYMWEAREMAQWVRERTTLVEDLSLGSQYQ